MGTQLDMRNRSTNKRVDDHIRQVTVHQARRLVFEQGLPLSSDRLKEVLSKFSGVPTYVGPKARCISWPMLIFILERLLDQARRSWSRLPQSVRGRSAARIRARSLEGNF
jgi:hypothetical protein